MEASGTATGFMSARFLDTSRQQMTNQRRLLITNLPLLGCAAWGDGASTSSVKFNLVLRDSGALTVTDY